MFASWCRDMWSIFIAYKYIERTAAGTIHRQRRQPGTEVTSTHDADGARRMFWDQVGVQWSWQSLLRLLEPSSVVILPLAVRQELSWVNSRLGESARRCVRCTGWFQPVNRCRLLSALTPGFISAFSCSSLTGLFAPSFRGTVKAALTGVSLHYLLTGSMSVPSFRLPVPIWLAVEALIVPCVLIGRLHLTSLPNSKNTPCQCQMLGARFFLLLAASFLPLILVKLKFTVPRGEQICTSWKMLFLLAVLIGSWSRVPFFCKLSEQHTFLLAAAELSQCVVGLDLRRKAHILASLPKYIMCCVDLWHLCATGVPDFLHRVFWFGLCAKTVHSLGSSLRQGELMLIWRKGRVRSCLPDWLHIPLQRGQG